MRAMTLSQGFLGIFLSLILFAVAQAQTDDRDDAALRLEIVRPADGQHVWLDEPTVELDVKVRAPAGLREVIAEASGPHTGVFFTLCGGDSGKCGKPPDYRFETSLPVFAGRNRIIVRATDRAGNTIMGTNEIEVSLAAHRSDGRERYDLLILTHAKPDGEDFKSALQPLVQHKNATGMRTKLLTLEEIYEVPGLRGHDHPDIIKRAIARARLQWGVKYVMLVGDSDRFPVRYIRIYDLGHWGHGFAPSDLYYADVFEANGFFESWDKDGDGLFGEGQGNFPATMQDLNEDDINLVPDVAVGRVPVSSLAELQTYVAKVILYETTADASWFNNALLVTGNYQGSNGTNDAIGIDLASAGFALNKQYHDLVWPGTTFNQRVAILQNALDDGVGFVSYVGHGGGVHSGKDGGSWGGWYAYDRIPNLSNRDRLPIIFSAACETAMFHYGNGPYFAKWGYKYVTEVAPPKYRWAPEPVSYSPSDYDVDAFAEHFLVKHDEGAIAFIGAYTGTQGDSHTLAKAFFKSYAGGQRILGDAWNAALKDFVNGTIANLGFPGTSWYTYAQWSHVNKMLLFGDPSLRIGGVKPDLRPGSPAPTGLCTVRDGKLVVRVENAGGGTAGPSVTRVDFGRHGHVDVTTPALQPKHFRDLLVPIPSGCNDPDCGFTIVTDYGNAVGEADESNNAASGNCPG